MKNKTLPILIILLVSASFVVYGKTTVNFFVDYNIITFAGFKDIIHFNLQNNISQYIEYNEIIPVYLAWKDKDTFAYLRNLIKEKKIEFFRIKKSNTSNKQEEWFFQEKEKIKKKIFQILLPEQKLYIIQAQTNFINIFNFIELKKILSTITSTSSLQELNFKIDLKLFLYSNIAEYFEIVKRFKGIKYNFFIISDSEYKAPAEEIEEFIDTVYSLRMKKNLTSSEKKILNFSLLDFTLKLSPSLNNILLNLFPLTSILPRRYRIYSTEYEIGENNYITLFDKENFFTFDTESGYLRKWFHYKSGTALINFNSLIEKVYISKRRKDKYNLITSQEIEYTRFHNGINFKITFPENLEMEKNIILQNQHLFLSYKIRNRMGRKQYYVFIIENKFSPSLYDMLLNLSSNIALYTPGRRNRFSNILSGVTKGLVNMDTGYGIYIDAYNRMDGIEIYKGFYYFNYIIYYRFYLYPYESRVITFVLRKIYFSKRKRKRYLNKLFNIKDQKWGRCEINQTK